MPYLRVKDSIKSMPVPRDTQLIQTKIKSNGHEVYNKMLPKNTALLEINHHINNFKLPVSIYINEVCQRENTHRIIQAETTDEQPAYDLDVLTEQIELFESEQQIDQYIAMQKLLSHNVENKLTNLVKSIIQVVKMKDQTMPSLAGHLGVAEVEEANITKERLNQIEDKCMKTLSRVQEERKKMNTCVICWQNSISVLFMPCRHMIVCKECMGSRQCPVCKKQVIDAITVFK